MFDFVINLILAIVASIGIACVYGGHIQNFEDTHPNRLIKADWGFFLYFGVPLFAVLTVIEYFVMYSIVQEINYPMCFDDFRIGLKIFVCLLPAWFAVLFNFIGSLITEYRFYAYRRIEEKLLGTKDLW